MDKVTEVKFKEFTRPEMANVKGGRKTGAWTTHAWFSNKTTAHHAYYDINGDYHHEKAADVDGPSCGC